VTVTAFAVDHDPAIRGQARNLFAKMIQWNVQAAGYVAAIPFLLAADVDNYGRFSGSTEIRQRNRRSPFNATDEIRPAAETIQSSVQVALHIIETDSSQSHDGFFLTARIGNDNDWLGSIEHRAGPCGVLTLDADVQGTGQMCPFEINGVANIEKLARIRQLQTFQRVPEGTLTEPSRLGRSCRFSMASWTKYPALRPGGDDGFEFFPAHRLQRVIELLLFADCGDGCGAHVFAAQ
jgi:hypothetical protein